VYRHRICDHLLLLRLCLVVTIIPLANARWQVAVVDVFVVVDVRRHAVAVVVTIVVIVIILVRRAIAVTVFVRRTVAIAIFVNIVVCCAVTIVAVVVRRTVTLVVDAIVHRTPTEKEAKTSSLLVFFSH
jgi:hypothetical protein